MLTTAIPANGLYSFTVRRRLHSITATADLLVINNFRVPHCVLCRNKRRRMGFISFHAHWAELLQ